MNLPGLVDELVLFIQVGVTNAAVPYRKRHFKNSAKFGINRVLRFPRDIIQGAPQADFTPADRYPVDIKPEAEKIFCFVEDLKLPLAEVARELDKKSEGGLEC